MRYNGAMKRLVVIFVFLIPVLFASAPVGAYAQSSDSFEEMKEILQDRIEDLKRELATLANKLVDKRQERFKEAEFSRTLTIGTRGEDVRTLQEFLANYTQFYPEKLVTGYFGPLTQAAIERFKAEYDIQEAGFGEEAQHTLRELFASRETFVTSIPPEFLSFSEEDDSDSEEFDIERLARDIHEEINEIRAEEGLPELTWSEELSDVARSHSRDQTRDNALTTEEEYICQYPIIRHEGFENGFVVRDRVENAGIEYRAVGENIAMVPLVKSRTYSYDDEDIVCPAKDIAPIESPEDEDEYLASLKEFEETIRDVGTVTFLKHELYERGAIIDLAVEGWMDSEGHRENILLEDYSRGGIGIERINNYLIITHNFIGT